jgi:Zn-dependent protease with chaperone function
MSYLIYVIIFLFTCNYFQILHFAKLVIGPKIKTEILKDDWINSVVKKKAGLNLKDITLFKDEKMYGMMTGLGPLIMPRMILSEGLYKNLNKDELEWVILHEAGHCVLLHNLQSLIIELIFLGTGLYLISTRNINLFMIAVLSLVLSIISIQVIRRMTEYTADMYSISRVDNPNGVITAQDKFRKGYKGSIFSNEKSIIRFLFHWNIYPSQRIKMAKKMIKLKNEK